MNNICNILAQLFNGCNLSSLFNCFGGNSNCGISGFFGGNCY